LINPSTLVNHRISSSTFKCS